MTILEQVKEVLKSEDVEAIQIEYVDGSIKDYSIAKSNKKETKKLLDSIKWDEVAQVQVAIADGVYDEEEGQ